jgi:aminoglycoside 6'-N-acetyltransferase
MIDARAGGDRDVAGAPEALWRVLRRDDNANTFVMRDGLAREAALAIAREFEARGHKQVYWIEPMPRADLVPSLPFDPAGIRLRRLREDDLPAFLAYRSDPQVARYQGWWPMDEARARVFLREQREAGLDAAGAWCQLAIADAADDRLLGDLGVWRSPDRTEAELGISVSPASQGRGVGRRAMRAALTLLFADPCVVRVHACADARNLPCRRMLAAAGFRETGTAEVFVKEEACIEHRYRVERGEYASASQGESA